MKQTKLTNYVNCRAAIRQPPLTVSTQPCRPAHANNDLRLVAHLVSRHFDDGLTSHELMYEARKYRPDVLNPVVLGRRLSELPTYDPIRVYENYYRHCKCRKCKGSRILKAWREI